MTSEPGPSTAPPHTGSTDRARPVLGAQPAPPGTTPLYFVSDVDESPSMEIVPARPYAEEDPTSLQLAISQLGNLDTSNANCMVEFPAQALYLLANGGFRPPQGQYPRRPMSPGLERVAGPCYECGDNHWAKDCPI